MKHTDFVLTSEVINDLVKGINELSDAIFKLVGDEPSEHMGMQDYLLIGYDIKDAIEKAKKYKNMEVIKTHETRKS